jgi:hypothetical protein
VDIAWIVQPDGRVQRVNVPNWNMAAQMNPRLALGYTPERDANWPIDFSQALAEFVVHRGSSPDRQAIAILMTEIPTQNPRRPYIEKRLRFANFVQLSMNGRSG